MPDDLIRPDPLTTRIDPKHGEASVRMTSAATKAQPHAPALARAGVPAGHVNDQPGKFGKMFPDLKPLVIDDNALFALAEKMKDTNTEGGNNPKVPAGYTYLGQFIDHDITLDLTPINARKVDPLALQNFRTPAIDLDSVYGLGPAQQPFMYERTTDGKITLNLLIGQTQGGPQPGGPLDPFPNDLPRNASGRALIGDERNDENLLVAQTHLAFLKFHNAVVRHLLNGGTELTGGALFDEARRIVTWHYQWIVLFDFVERLTEPGLIRRIKHEGRRFYRFAKRPYMPIEFSAAAYRFGHSMVREAYGHNRIFNRDGQFGTGTLKLLFHFTGKSGAIAGDLALDASKFPEGPVVRTLPSNWIVDWRRLYDFGQDEVAMNQSRALDPFITESLHTLPGESGREANLAFRNLRRGVLLELPSGQDIASKGMGLEPLSPDEIAEGADGQEAARHGLHQRTPLWYYVLKEAEVRGKGERLGPVGSTIVAETFLGMVAGDEKSFLSVGDDWRPHLPSAVPGEFTMVDLLNFVGDVNPLG